MAAVLGGDLLVLFAFIATGQYSHGYLFWQYPEHTILITIPFVIAWFLFAPAVGLYSLANVRSYRRTVPLVAGTWIGTALVGGVIRSTELFPGGAPVTFLLANVVFGLLYFLPWRMVVSWRLRG